jgi:2'-phosphotransferase
MIKIDETSAIEECLHGTYYKNWESIKQHGLSRMNRQHIHLSEDFPGSKDVISGMRNNCELAIYIDIHKALKGKP